MAATGVDLSQYGPSSEDNLDTPELCTEECGESEMECDEDPCPLNALIHDPIFIVQAIHVQKHVMRHPLVTIKV